VGTASLAVKPSSVFSDKIIVRSVNVQGPEISCETDLRDSNLKKLLSNLEGPVSEKKAGQPAEQQAKASKKLEVDEFMITGGKIHVNLTLLSGASATVPLPEIRLSNLGTNAEGITVAELSQQVLKVILEAASKEAIKVATDLSKGSTYLNKELGTNNVEKITRGLGDLLKKK
jgi:hypothetical protein